MSNTDSNKIAPCNYLMSLTDIESVWVDEKGRSPAYFCKMDPVCVGENMLTELKNASAERNGENVRICLHSSPEASFHDMLILVRKKRYYPPHKHKNDETFHMKEGQLAIFAFSDTGEILDACILSEKGNFLYRIGANRYHAIYPLTDVVIYHEAKPGPFTGPDDSIFAPWAPDESAAGAIDEFNRRLTAALGEGGKPPLKQTDF